MAAYVVLSVLLGGAWTYGAWRWQQGAPARAARRQAELPRLLEDEHQRRRAARPSASELPPTHQSGGRRPRRRRRSPPGWGPGAGVACLLFFLLAGVVPVWQWVDAWLGPERATVWSLLGRLVALGVTGTLLVVWLRVQVTGRAPGSSGPSGRP